MQATTMNLHQAAPRRETAVSGSSDDLGLQGAA